MHDELSAVAHEIARTGFALLRAPAMRQIIGAANLAEDRELKLPRRRAIAVVSPAAIA